MPHQAAILVIGDEILSGRTRDSHVQTLARFLLPFGITVGEARIIGDDPAQIVAALNALRSAHDYVFTTGGIGPTHDDRTADAVASAFGVPIDVNDEAKAMLQAHYARSGTKLNAARLRMARIPHGAALIRNPLTGAPGFQLGNVFVLAGVPAVLRAMLADVAPHLHAAAPPKSVSIRAPGLREGDIALELGDIAEQFPGLSIGSYPWLEGEDHGVNLVARGQDAAQLDEAARRLRALVREHGVTPQ